MTSTGCLILLGRCSILPLALTGPALGLNWTIYIAYLIPPVLVVFAVLQVLRFGIRRGPGGRASGISTGRKDRRGGRADERPVAGAPQASRLSGPVAPDKGHDVERLTQPVIGNKVKLAAAREEILDDFRVPL